jgi:tRNA pseudouridine65 synthase
MHELELLYRDDTVAIVNKPSGIAVHKGMDRSDDNVLTRLRRQLRGWVWPVHRLDRATSGVLVFGLNEEAASALGGFFARGEVKKHYLAWTRGIPSPESGFIDYAVPKSEESEERIEARTRYATRAIANDPRTGLPRYALVACAPETGRYHQIRRHMKHLRCPLLGDTTYGDGKDNRALREHAGLRRLALHASALTLPHPFEEGRILEISAPMPDDLRIPMRHYGLSDEVLQEASAFRVPPNEKGREDESSQPL